MPSKNQKFTSCINPKYAFANRFVGQLTKPGWFNSPANGTVLHAGRNTIKMFESNGVKLVVKRFGRLSILNRIIYGRLRKSKACRAYEYATKLRELGIDTPEEVAYTDIRKHGLLAESYFVSLHTEYHSMLPFFHKRTLNKEEFQRIVPLLNALVKFLLKLHEAGVIHNDLNYTNILYNYPDSNSPDINNLPAEEEKYSFTIIDINRMEFKQRLSLEERLHNLRRLNVSAPAYTHIFQEYAKNIGENPQRVEQIGLKFRKEFVDKREKNKRIKGYFRKRKK